MSVYTEFYGDIYGGGGVAGLVLGLTAELYTGTWTDITDYVYQRNPVQIQLGRQDESSEISPASCSMTLNNRDGRFTTRNPTGPYYGTIGQNTPFRLSVPAYLAGQGTALLFADDNQSSASCPDATALHLTSNFDVRIDMWLDDHQPCTLAGKWGTADTTWAWCLVLNGDGTLSLIWYDGSNVSTAQSTAPLPYLGRIMVRAFFDAGDLDAPAVTFYTAPDMAGSQTQLGEAVTIGATDYAQVGTDQEVQIGYVAGFIGQGLLTGNSGCLGRVFEFQLYNSSATLVADPVFSSQTAGATSFEDAQGNTWTMNGTATLDDRCYRFHGEMSAWPKAADPSSRDSYSQATASGVLRRLQQGTTPVLSVMRRGVVSYPSGPSTVDGDAAAPQSTVGYWPCEDGVGSTSFAAGIGQNSDGLRVQPMQFSGIPAIQAQAGTPEADSVFACSAQLPQVQQSRWTATVPPYSTSSTAFTLLFLLAIPSGGISADADLLDLVFTVPGFASFTLSLNYATGSLGSLTLDVSGTPTSAITGVNGNAYWVAISNVGTGTATAKLSVLQVGTDIVTSVSGVSDDGGLVQFTVNPLQANLGDTEMGQFWASAQWSSGASVPAAPDIGTLYQLADAYLGETAAYRVARLCSENGLNSRIYGFPDVSVPMGAQPIDTLANLLQYCEATDMGLLFEPRETTGAGYRTSHSMLNQSPAAVANYAQQQVSQGFADTADDLLTLNDVIASNADGSSAEQTLTSGPMSIQPPPSGIGPVSNTIDVYPAADAQLPDLAGWMLHVRSVDEDRYPSIPFQMARTTTPQAIPLLRIGDYLQITNPPYWIPPGPVKQLCAGFSETFAPGIVWPITVNGVPESPYEVATAGTDATDSAFAESSGTTLASGYSSTAASFSVDVTGPLWVTGTVSINVMIAGEEIEVTAISGASSPQTFTVSRSVNGVVKAQSSGAAVTIVPEPIAALV